MYDPLVAEVQRILTLRKRHSIASICSFALIIFVGLFAKSIFVQLLFYGSFFSGVWFFAKWVVLGWSVRRNAWDIFIKHYKVQLLPITDRPIIGSITLMADSFDSDILFEGRYKDRKIRFFTVTLRYSNKKSWFTRSRVDGFYSYRVFEIVTNKKFHHVFLDSKVNNRFGNRQMSTIRSAIRNNPKIKTDGDVGKYFDAYVPENSSFHGLVTLTPNVLLVLRDLAKPFDVEFIGNSILIITDNKLGKIKDIMLYQERVVQLIELLGDNLVRRSDVKEAPLKIKKY
jgi:hypothetical protein